MGNFIALSSCLPFIIINKDVECPEGKALLVCDDPFTAYVSIVKKTRPFEPLQKNISSTAEVGAGTIIQPNVIIGNHVSIGRNCVIHPGVVIYDHSVIGNNVIIGGKTHFHYSIFTIWTEIFCFVKLFQFR